MNIENESSSITEKLRESYNDLQYTSHPLPGTHPSLLGAVAKLLNLNTTNISSARILEIGCASGGNLIPLAARNPGCYCLGIDLSEEQVAEGVRRIKSLSLKNIDLLSKNLLEFEKAAQPFDFIICHGMYSWVPKIVQEKILSVIKDNLSENGVALISYNVLPGWRVKQVMRDAFSLHGDSDGKLIDRVTQSRQLLAFLQKFSNDSTGWGKALIEICKELSLQPDYYIGHEYLEPCNEPVFLTEFISRLDSKGLVYLGDHDPRRWLPEARNPAAAEFLRATTGNNWIAIEQYFDILEGTQFRSSLVVHDVQLPKISRQIIPDRCEDLYLIPKTTISETKRDGRFIFSAKEGTFKTSNPVVAKAVRTIFERAPKSTTIAHLVSDPSITGGPVSTENLTNIQDAALKLLFAGLVTVYAEDPGAKGLTRHPVVCPLIRSDAMSGQPFSANRLHRPVIFTDLTRFLVSVMDGTNDRADLLDLVKKQVEIGALKLDINDAMKKQMRPLDVALPKIVDEALSEFEKNFFYAA